MRTCTVLLAVAIPALLGGCASVVNGSSQMVPVSSDPVGAAVLLDDAPAGVTPCKLALDRKCDHILTLRKEGYEEHSMEMRRTASMMVFGNLLVGGMVGLYADSQGGAQFQFVNDKVHVQLKPSSAPPPAAPTSRPAS